ncbi:hypothetical protein [Methylobacterium isbiliense]|jgi:hypothetical protein|uniref:Uncharacterized protein n=1 Tax=Methylobacterium isbiliense TaxID=315478 RepID=A0ABQ4S9P2_9HYPH|nr:hypothetical protein [Methylobacterium isbiliense]MDN3625461.1 hypothetical protein [Methylobacterium isbiliense]GJD99097.1 hypothetical protein GMJLKIPL_1013 [Methylobacterium isbiliense]
MKATDDPESAVQRSAAQTLRRIARIDAMWERDLVCLLRSAQVITRSRTLLAQPVPASRRPADPGRSP